MKRHKALARRLLDRQDDYLLFTRASYLRAGRLAQDEIGTAKGFTVSGLPRERANPRA